MPREVKDASFIHLFKKAPLNSFHKVCTHQAGWVLRPTQHGPCLLGPFIRTVIDESASPCKQILHTTNTVLESPLKERGDTSIYILVIAIHFWIMIVVSAGTNRNRAVGHIP